MNFLNKLNENNTYKKIFVKPWTYKTGAILLTVVALLHIILLNSAWGITGPFTIWGGKILQALGINVSEWQYFTNNPGMLKNLNTPILKHGGSVRNIGIILGGLIAALLASEFKFSTIKNKKEIFSSIAGGFLMGVGARIASGCNIGAFFSAIMSYSLTGWLFGIFTFFGAYIGSKIFLKYVL